MGNDIAGGKVTPELEVLDIPHSTESGKVPQKHTDLFPSCTVICVQARRNTEVSFSDSILMPVFSGEAEALNKMEIIAAAPREHKNVAELVQVTSQDMPLPESISLPVTQECLCAAQGADPTFKRCLMW